MFFGWRVITLGFLLLYGVPNSSADTLGQLPNSLLQPGSPFPVKTNNPEVQRATRLGVYKYNNSSNDIFLFKESHINKATMQIVKGVKYRLNVDICRTVCSKRIPHPNLDRCDFQKSKGLRKEASRDGHMTRGCCNCLRCGLVAKYPDYDHRTVWRLRQIQFYGLIFTCNFEIWLLPWQQKVRIPVMFCH